MNAERLASQFPQVKWDAATGSWIVPHQVLLDVAHFLKNDPEFRMDMLSNVTGVDWLSARVKVRGEDGKETEQERPGYLEVIYHFFSVIAKQGPIVLRCRTDGRETPMIPSLTPLFRSAEFQEREIFDLFGIVFGGHPDLRRILMWDEFKDFPMRKDYVEPDDYEWEPTPHDEVLEKARRHAPSSPPTATHGS
jgi:NADH-quinone oxidoreductase subunit C